MQKSTLIRVTVSFLLISLFIAVPSSTLAFEPLSGGCSPITDNFNETESSLVIPQVFIDGEKLSSDLVLTSLAFGCLQSNMFHMNQNFESWTIKHFEEEIEDKLVSRELIVREAKKTGLTVDEDSFEQDFKKHLMQMGGEEAMTALLQKNGLSLEKYRTLSRHAYMARMYAEKNLRPAVSEAMLRDYYMENRLQFGQGERRIVSFIEFHYPDAPGPAAIEDLKARAKSIVDVDTLKKAAEKYKDKFGRKIRTKVLTGIVHSEERPGVLWETVKKMSEGECVVFNYTPRQYNLVLLQETQPEDILPFEIVREKLRLSLTQSLFNENIKTKVNELKSSSNIEIVHPDSGQE